MKPKKANVKVMKPTRELGMEGNRYHFGAELTAKHIRPLKSGFLV